MSLTLPPLSNYERRQKFYQRKKPVDLWQILVADTSGSVGLTELEQMPIILKCPEKMGRRHC
jgi:hypothetical protein